MTDKKKTPAPRLNTRQRKAIARKAAKNTPKDHRQIAPEVHVYTDDSYKDKAKKVYTSSMQQVKERIAAINAKFDLPQSITTVCKPITRLLRCFRRRYTSVLLLNKDGRQRDFLPDKPGDHRLLVHRCIARQLVSGVCMFVRVTASEDRDGNTIDGSWAIVPAQYAMLNTTTIQELRMRPFFIFRRYWYEITFDGRVQPAHLLFDYGLNPAARKTRLYVTHEYVPVRKTDNTNSYFRFWKEKPKGK